MSGNANPARSRRPCVCSDEWFDLVDLATDQVVGQVTRLGQVRHADPETTRRITSAFDRDIMRRGDDIAHELGVCFAGIETVTPRDAAHDELIFRNLAILTGLVPQLPNVPKTRQGS